MTRTSTQIIGLLCLLCFACPSTAQELAPILIESPRDSGAEELPPASRAIIDGLDAALDGQSSGSLNFPTAELVTQRYEDGKVKIEREVVQDEDQNYVNHGKWKSYSRDGKVAIEGRFKLSQMDGVWTRIYRQREPRLLNIAPFNQGQMPLVSQANFNDGKLHGKWVIYDSMKRRLCEWTFNNGKRDGTSTWWFAGGMKMREINYKDGTIHGAFNEWDRSGRQVTKDVYTDGSRLAPKTEYFADRRKRAEGTVLYPKLVLQQADDWMECTLATYEMNGEPVKNGVWVSWYPNGQKKHQGTYEDDMPNGEFTWWHENGQRSLVANYKDGKKEGGWTWWHPNGLKSIQGEYADNMPTSKWLWWAETGKVAQRADMSDPDQRQILAMPANGTAAPPSSDAAPLPSPRTSSTQLEDILRF